MAVQDKLSDWLQVIGTFGVIASLIFVGMQMRQAHEIALSQTYQARSDATTEFTMATTGSPELLSAIVKIYQGTPGEVTPVEGVALEHYVATQFHFYENLHRQYELGFLDEEHWMRIERNMTCNLEHPLFRELIAPWRFRDPFEDLIERFTQIAIADPSGCWDAEGVAPMFRH